MPDDFFRVDGLAVHDGGDFAVRAARVKADAAAVRVAARFFRLFVRGREVRFVRNHNFKRPLIDILHKAHVKFARAAHAVCVLHPLCDRVVAAEIHAPAADRPEEHLHKALDKARIRLGKFRAAELRLKHGNKAVFTFDSDPERLSSVFQIGLRPNAERNEVLVQQGLIFQGVCNTEIVHSALLFAHSGSMAAAASSQMTVTSGWNCKIEPGTSGVTGPKKTL